MHLRMHKNAAMHSFGFHVQGESGIDTIQALSSSNADHGIHPVYFISSVDGTPRASNPSLILSRPWDFPHHAFSRVCRLIMCKARSKCSTRTPVLGRRKFGTLSGNSTKHLVVAEPPCQDQLHSQYIVPFSSELYDPERGCEPY